MVDSQLEKKKKKKKKKNEENLERKKKEKKKKKKVSFPLLDMEVLSRGTKEKK